MSAPIPLRRDFGASQLRGLAKKTKDGPQARRLLALAAIYDGATRTEASANPTTISSTIVARPGTSSSISPGASCPSDCANGPTGSDQWDLV